MSSESLVQNVDTDDPVDERLAKREKNRKGLHQLLNPAAMSAEQNKTIKNYPTTGWQDGTCTGRWDGFQAIWGTYKLVPEQDHALRFLTYVPNEVGSEPSPLLISWHGGGFVSQIINRKSVRLISPVHRRCRLRTMGCPVHSTSSSRSQSRCCVLQLPSTSIRGW